MSHIRMETYKTGYTYRKFYSSSFRYGNWVLNVMNIGAHQNRRSIDTYDGDLPLLDEWHIFFSFIFYTLVSHFTHTNTWDVIFFSAQKSIYLRRYEVMKRRNSFCLFFFVFFFYFIFSQHFTCCLVFALRMKSTLYEYVVRAKSQFLPFFGFFIFRFFFVVLFIFYLFVCCQKKTMFSNIYKSFTLSFFLIS